jgi:hypothetical protein
MGPTMTLKDLGIDGGWRIVTGDSPAEKIAAGELRGFLKDAGLELAILSGDETSAAPRFLLRASGEEERDAFRLTRDDRGICISGSNPRSVLYGVYRLIDWLGGDRESDALDVEESAHFVERWMPATLHGRTDDERNIRYLARIGVNTSYLRGRRDELIEVKHLTHYVADRVHLPEISEACPPNPRIVAMARGAYALARRYGLNVTMFQDEPVALVAPDAKSPDKRDGLPPSLMEKLPAGMLGEAYRLQYRRDGWKALSVFHPAVEQHYRELIRQALALFPDLRTLYLYNEDAGASNVRPPAEPCAPHAYPPGYDGYPYAAHLHLAEVIQEAGREINPSFRVATVTYHWYQPDDLRRRMVAGLPRGSVLVSLAAWDDSVDTTVMPEWTKDLFRQAQERGDLVLLADDDFNGTSDDLLMEITAGFPMPIRTYRKLHMWAKAGAAGVTQHHTGGATLGVNSITDLAWREFTWRPLVALEEAESKILALLRKQLGDEAAAEMMLACRAVDRALDAVEAGADNRPYGSRLHHSYSTFMFPPHLEQGLRRAGPSTSDYCGDGIHPEAWRETLRQETAACAEALEHAQRAVALAPERKVPFHLHFPSHPPMSCAEYARVMSNAVEIVLCFKRTFLNFMEAESAGEDGQAAIWKREKSNIEALVRALEVRRRWMQSPYGTRILERLIARCEEKVEILARLGL